MADLYTIANVTIYGANGGIQIAGIADADMISIAFSDDWTLVEQHDGLNKVTGVVAHNSKNDLNLTFYPLPGAAATSTTTAPKTVDQVSTSFQAIKLPDPLAQVHLFRRSPTASPAQLPTSIAGGDYTDARTYRYIGGGSMQFTANGLMTMTLPLRRWARIDVPTV